MHNALFGADMPLALRFIITLVVTPAIVVAAIVLAVKFGVGILSSRNRA